MMQHIGSHRKYIITWKEYTLAGYDDEGMVRRQCKIIVSMGIAEDHRVIVEGKILTVSQFLGSYQQLALFGGSGG